MNCFSESEIHRASLGKSLMKKKAATATRMLRIPSRMKIHLQLLSPPAPSILAMADARRPPKAEARSTEEK